MPTRPSCSVIQVPSRPPAVASLHLSAFLQVEPRAAAGNQDVEGPITDSLAPFKKVSEVPFIAAGEYRE